MGEVRRRGRIYWIRYYRDGRRFEESARTDKFEAARDLLKVREGDIAKGAAMTAKVGQLRFEDAAKDLIADYRVNGKRTLKDLTRRVDDILSPWFRGRRLATIGTADIRAYVAHRQTQGAANASINLELANLKRMFTLATQAGKLLQRPYIPMLKEDNVRKGFFERAQFDGVRARLQAPLDAAVTLAYYTGWRMASEILPLYWRQIDRAAGVIRLEPGTTKNRDGRVFKYAELTEVKAAIEALWGRHGALAGKGIISPLVFCRGGGQAIKSFYTKWDQACTAAGCPGRIPHDFRRTAVGNLNRAGVPETVAMKITGHKTRSVFDRYDITSEEDLTEAARKLQAMTGTIPGTIDEKPPLKMNAAFGRKSRRGLCLPSGDRGGDRTRGPRIKSALLYH
jgi:integrase